MLENLKKDLNDAGNSEVASQLQRFFKIGVGEYGEGDVFLGIKVPIQRKICKKYYDLELSDLQELLNSRVHEHRMCALFILIHQYFGAQNNLKKKIVEFYLKNTKNINNWDLVDLSAHKILGDYLIERDRIILYNLAKSNNLWEKRISIISCFAFIRKNDFNDALKISEILLSDTHDLIHKAVGWMLREIGKKNLKIEEDFLKKHYKDMPRTMLRYAIERFEEDKRKAYLLGEV